MNTNDPIDSELEQALQSALTPPPFRPESDSAFLRELQDIAAACPKRQRSTLQIGRAVSLSLAAAVLLSIALWPRPPEGTADSMANAATHLPYDINVDGQLDILDAFALARKLHAGELDPAHDITGDGFVNQADIDELAERAVRLPEQAS